MATIKLYINTDRGDISRAFVKSTSEPTANALPPDLVAGNKRNIEVYLIDSAGNYDARSGASNYALSIGAGPLAGTPSSGTYTLTDGTSTTTALAFNAGAQAVEDALNALNSGAGPHSQLVDVTSTYDGNYLVKFRTTGAVANLSGDASELSPASAVVIDEAVAGDGSTKEQQYIRLLRQPAIFQDSFTQIADGWSGELSANNARVLELMAGRDTIAIPLDVELTETGNEPETIARGNMLLSNEVINPASIDPANLAQLLTEAVGDARYLRTTNNLSDVTDAATARSNIGAAAAADLTSHTNNTSNPHSVTAAQVGLGNVDNTSDADKPVSTAQQTALDLKADATALTTETNARIDADNRREFAGGVVKTTNNGQLFTLNPFNLSFSDFSIFTTVDIKTFAESPIWRSNSSGVNRVELRIENSGDLAVRFVNSSNSITNYSSGLGSINLGLNNCLFVFNRNENLYAYINGSLVGSVDISSLSTIDVSNGNTNNSDIYSLVSNALSDFAIFNTALTATQAAELYQQGLQPWLAANPEYRRGQEVYASDFSSSNGNFVSNNSSWTYNNVNAWEYDAISNSTLYKNVGLVPGKAYRITITATSASTEIRLYSHYLAQKTLFTNIPINQIQSLSVGDNVFEGIVPNDGTAIFLLYAYSAGGAFNVSSIKVEQVGSLATLPLNDDCRQLKDISGNRNDATASESGVTHLKQANQHSFRDDHADGTGGSYLIANADILAENEVITGVTVDGRFYAASGDQDLTKRRIKLQDHGSHVDIKRSNGTADDLAIAVTNPSDGTDFAITVLTQRI